MKDNQLFVSPLNEAFIQIDCERGMAKELSEYFTFALPNQHFNPSVRAGWWDGKIRLFSLRDQTLYRGLFHKVEEFATSRNYELFAHPSLTTAESFSIQEAKDFIDSLKLTGADGKPLTVRDFQLEAFVKSIRFKRRLWLSPTASGKSLIAYLIIRYLENTVKKPALIIVPTTGLVEQLHSDFKEYSQKNKWDVDDNVHKIYYGHERDFIKPVNISTWQSLDKMPVEYFESITTVIGDEAHLYKAKSAKRLMENMPNAEYRIGMTGTLDGTQTHQLVLEGLFGPVERVLTTKEMIDRKHASDFQIKCLVLKYPEEDCKAVSKMKYQDEVNFILSNEERNKFITNLALSLEGNTFVMCEKIDKHAKVLYNMISSKAGKKRKVFLIYGAVKGEEREEIRKIVNKEKNAIVVASFGTMSTGTNIPNLHNMIFTSPFKSVIRTLQSIGRTLRLSKTKKIATLFDLADDLRYKLKENYAIKHFIERVGNYKQEKFKFKQYKIDLIKKGNITS